MKKTSKLFALVMTLVMVAATAVIFTGCGGEKTFADYVNSNEDLKAELESYSQSDATGDMTIEIKENTIVYTYQYKDTMDSSVTGQMKDYFVEYMDTFGTTFESIAKTCEEESGIKGIQVNVIYRNGDGTDLFNEIYTAK